MPYDEADSSSVLALQAYTAVTIFECPDFVPILRSGEFTGKIGVVVAGHLPSFPG
jgi:hypothetical protein